MSFEPALALQESCLRNFSSYVACKLLIAHSSLLTAHRFLC